MGIWKTALCGSLLDLSDRWLMLQMGLPLSGSCIHSNIVTRVRCDLGGCIGVVENMDIAPGYCSQGGSYLYANNNAGVSYYYRWFGVDVQRAMREGLCGPGNWNMQLYACIKNGVGCSPPVSIETIVYWVDRSYNIISTACTQAGYNVTDTSGTTSCGNICGSLLHGWDIDANGGVFC